MMVGNAVSWVYLLLRYIGDKDDQDGPCKNTQWKLKIFPALQQRKESFIVSQGKLCIGTITPQAISSTSLSEAEGVMAGVKVCAIPGALLTNPLDTANLLFLTYEGSGLWYSSMMGCSITICLWIVSVELVGTVTQLSTLKSA